MLPAGHQSDSVSVVKGSAEYYFNDDEASIILSMGDEGNGPYFTIKTEGDVSFDSKEDFTAIIDDFLLRFPL